LSRRPIHNIDYPFSVVTTKDESAEFYPNEFDFVIPNSWYFFRSASLVAARSKFSVRCSEM
jgi:hypothetical protein